MDRSEFRQYLSEQLALLPKVAVVAFAVRTALRVLPLLARQRVPDAEAFQYWEKTDRGRHLFAVFSASNVALLVACGEAGLVEAARAARTASRSAAADADAAAAYTAYAAAYAAAAADDAHTHADAADAAAYAAEAVAYAAAADAAAAYTAYAAAYAVDRSDAADVYAVDRSDAADAYVWGNSADDKFYVISAIKNDLALAAFSKESISEFLIQPLWPYALPAGIQKLHESLKSAVIQLDPSFSFWLDFYQDRLDGKPFDLPLMRQAALLPESIKAEGSAQINAYLLNLRNQSASQPLNRVRAIFLGDGEAGKTSLVKVLFGEDVPEAKEPMTPGIDIREWPVPDTKIKAHFWDFWRPSDDARHPPIISARSLLVRFGDEQPQRNQRHRASAILAGTRKSLWRPVRSADRRQSP